MFAQLHLGEERLLERLFALPPKVVFFVILLPELVGGRKLGCGSDVLVRVDGSTHLRRLLLQTHHALLTPLVVADSFNIFEQCLRVAKLLIP